MKHCLLRISIILCFVFSLVSVLSSQNILNPGKKETPATGDTVVAPILPFALADISRQANASQNLVQDAGSQRLTEFEAAEFRSKVDTLIHTIDAFFADTTLLDLSDYTVRELGDIESRVKIFQLQISPEQSKLNRRYDGLEAKNASLETKKKRWKATREQSGVEQVPEPLLQRIDLTMASIDSVSSLLQEDMNRILMQLDRLFERNNQLEALNRNIQTARLSRSVQMFSRDRPYFFKDLRSLGDSALVQKHAQTILRDVKADVRIFDSEFSGAMKFMIVFFIVLLSFLFWFKGNYTKVISMTKISLTDEHLKLIQAPLMVTLFIIAIVTRFALPEIPYMYRAINILILIVPMVIMTKRVFGSDVISWMYWLIAVYVISLLYELLYAPDILQRIFLMFLSLAGLLLFVWMLLTKPAYGLFRNKSTYNLVRRTEMVFAGMLFAAMIANLVGAVSLAGYLTLVPMQIAFLALAVKIVTRFVDFIFYVALASNFILRVNAISDFFELIHSRITRFVNLGFWIFFAVTALGALRVKQVFFEWGHEFLSRGRTIGAVELSLRSVLIFVFVIWLALFITKIIRYILERDVFARVSVSKGIPGTIIMLVRIALISGGFMLAAAAAGMELTNLSIVLGAFSVGIGFGLQNIFNNMVSGLILAFERPINVGDVVQVGELMGTVLNIGLRASRVKSFDGAEVIVPNGNLISDQLVNWTLSDAYRRMDIRVGVAYGTDPKKVVAIIREVAESHEVVRQEPPPSAYFIGFGESSLDFRLLAWVEIENRLEVESDLNTTINEKLKEAGIEIPFPQRDLHIRSDATKAKPGTEEQK